VLFALACGVLAAASIASFRREAAERDAAESFVRRFALDMRRPDEIGAMKYEPAADLAASIAVNAALADLGAGATSPGASPVDTTQEAAAARDIMLDAMAKRPGWAYHRFLLGRLAYRLPGAAADPSSTAWQAWAVPLRLAAEAAPGLDATWAALAGAYLQNWRKLSPAQRTEALPILRRALQDATFLSAQFLPLSEALGPDQASSLLPENSELLSAAASAFASHGDLGAAKSLIDRADAAEKNERREGLEKIEGRFRMRDRDGLAAACLEWASRHSVAALDDAAGRAQAARILELWPGDRGGPWESDPRAELVRFFLEGRESSVAGETLARTVAALSDVPDYVMARVTLRAGDVSAAQEFASHPQDPGAPEWVPYYTDLARLLLKQGRARDARGALDLVPFGAREDCDGLLARRDVARALKDTGELAVVAQRLDAVRNATRSIDAPSEAGTISACLDPEQNGGQPVSLRLSSAGPSLVQYGWGRGRSGTALIQGDRVFSVPTEGLSGRRDLTVRSIAGSPVRAAILPAVRP
jgi:thioredoxin-like negative regulator of GroEL